MADELDDLFGSEEGDGQQQLEQQEPVFDEAALEDDMDMGPAHNEVGAWCKRIG